MAAAAIPVAASLAGPAVGSALLGGTALASAAPWLVSAAGGALTGGLGSYLMGQNPMKGAFLGGIGSGISSATGLSDKIGGIFGGGSAASGEAGGVSMGGNTNPLTGTIMSAPASSDGVSPSVLSSIQPQAATPSFWSKNAVPLGLGAASLLANRMQGPAAPVSLSPKQEAPYEKAKPLQRNYTQVDPQSYATSGGNRSYFGDNISGLSYAKGGAVDRSMKRVNNDDAMQRRAMVGDGPMSSAADFVTQRYMNSDYPGDMPHYMQDEYGDVPITRRMQNPRGYANGGSSMASSMNIPMGKCYAGGGGIGSYVQGPGDGKSDSIPAKLSDGEYVISAPAVSALGNGSNKAGAKKLDKMHQTILSKHYKGKSPKRAMGLGSYMGAMA